MITWKCKTGEYSIYKFIVSRCIRIKRCSGQVAQVITLVTSTQKESFPNPRLETDYFDLFFVILLSSSIRKSG